MWIDSHNHIYSEKFDEDRDAVIQRALDHGVKRFFLPAIDATYTERMLEVERQYPQQMQLMMGLHPTSVHPDSYTEELEKVKHWLDIRPFAAVGEIGIDLYWEKKYLKEQQDAFEKQIKWALAKDLPIVIHTRDSFPETFEVVEHYNNQGLKGIFHCFSGTLEDAKRALELGFLLGIGGVVTFKNGKIDQFLNEIPLEKIVLETDAPYLAPVPHRGKRNEPAYIPLIAEKLSEIYQKPLEEIAGITSANAENLFKIY